MRPIVTIVGGALIIAGCNQQADRQATNAAEQANAEAPAVANGAEAVGEGSAHEIVDSQGKTIGTVATHQETGGVKLTVEVSGLPAGQHGIHIHEVGKCDPPKFESAGAHWNWASKKHGHQNPAGYHAGDLGNITVADDGKGKAEMTVEAKDWNANIANGLALVIHAKPDDEKTDPSGNSGDRIACGLLFPAP
jgi:superoxide dismutase, Cu-Zn family